LEELGHGFAMGKGVWAGWGRKTRMFGFKAHFARQKVREGNERKIAVSKRWGGGVKKGFRFWWKWGALGGSEVRKSNRGGGWSRQKVRRPNGSCKGGWGEGHLGR